MSTYDYQPIVISNEEFLSKVHPSAKVTIHKQRILVSLQAFDLHDFGCSTTPVYAVVDGVADETLVSFYTGLQRYMEDLARLKYPELAERIRSTTSRYLYGIMEPDAIAKLRSEVNQLIDEYPQFVNEVTTHVTRRVNNECAEYDVTKKVYHVPAGKIIDLSTELKDKKYWEDALNSEALQTGMQNRWLVGEVDPDLRDSIIRFTMVPIPNMAFRILNIKVSDSPEYIYDVDIDVIAGPYRYPIIAALEDRYGELPYRLEFKPRYMATRAADPAVMIRLITIDATIITPV